MRAVLLSGGMDSIALTFWQRPEITFTIDYGQAAAATELAVSAHVSAELGIPNVALRIDCSSLGSGDLAGTSALEIAPASEWWPFRNQLLLTLAGMKAVTLGVRELMVGSVLSDGSHADGRYIFYTAADSLMSLQEGGIRVSAPAIDMSTAELVRISAVPLSLLAWAHSCHVGSLACGVCRGCVKHFEVTRELSGVGY